jgi:hypothetical protein
MLNRLFVSDKIAPVDKSYHLTAVLQLVGYRYQEAHPGNPRTF